MKLLKIGILVVVFSCVGRAPNPKFELGNWGGTKPEQNTSLTINEQNLLFDFTCASATIDSDLRNETRTSFSLSGIYFIQRPILPEGYDIEKDKHKAKFDFVFSKKIVTITIFDETADKKIGVFIYQKNLVRQVYKCP
jgi:hypothetical protein